MTFSFSSKKIKTFCSKNIVISNIENFFVQRKNSSKSIN